MVETAVITTMLAPFLPVLLNGAGEVAKGAASGAGGDTWNKVKQIWDKLWPKAQQKPGLKEALEDAAATPDDEDVKAALRLQLKKLLAADEDLAKELKALLTEEEVSGGGMTTNVQVTGDRNVTKTMGNISAGGDVSF